MSEVVAEVVQAVAAVPSTYAALVTRDHRLLDTDRHHEGLLQGVT